MAKRFGMLGLCVGLLMSWLACGGTSAPGERGEAPVTPVSPCVPSSCESLAAACGRVTDGCGGTLSCGTCGEGESCGGGGTANQCGAGTCEPKSCEALVAECGELSDGCGDVLSCGTCGDGERCGAKEPNRCGETSECQPKTCAQAGAACGRVTDGCGGTLSCGACPEGESCGGGGTANQCGAGTCEPKTCESLGVACGEASDGCGDTVDCGPCSTGGEVGFLKRYGSSGRERVESAAAANDGSFFIHGEAVRQSSFGGEPFTPENLLSVIVRYSAEGSHLWTRQMPPRVQVLGIDVSGDHGVAVAGRYTGSPDLGGGPLPEAGNELGLFVLRLSASGAFQWSQGFVVEPSESSPETHLSGGLALTGDPFGGAVVAASFQGRITIGTQAFGSGASPRSVLLSFDAQGERRFGRIFAPYIAALTTDAEGNAVFGGSGAPGADFGASDGREGLFLVSLERDNGGNRWVRILTGSTGALRDLDRAPDGSVVAAADRRGGSETFGTSAIPASTGTDLLLFKVTTSGEPVWARLYGGAAAEHQAQVDVDAEGNIAASVWANGSVNLGGDTFEVPTGEAPTQIFVARYDADGRHLWSRHVQNVTPHLEAIHALVAQPGAAVVASYFDATLTFDGRTIESAGEQDVVLIQLED